MGPPLPGTLPGRQRRGWGGPRQRGRIPEPPPARSTGHRCLDLRHWRLGGDTGQEWKLGNFSSPSVLPLGTSCPMVFICFLFSELWYPLFNRRPSVVAHTTQGKLKSWPARWKSTTVKFPFGVSTGRTQPSPAGPDVPCPSIQPPKPPALGPAQGEAWLVLGGAQCGARAASE